MLVIACATPAESGALKKNISIREQKRYQDACFISGTFLNRDILFVQTGIGPRRAKSAAQLIVNQYHPAYIILLGAAGAVDPSLQIGDIIIINNILRKAGPIHNTRNIVIEQTFFCHPGLNRIAHHTITQAGMTALWGNCLTTERFVHLKAKKAWIHETFRVQVIEMESAAMAKIFDHARVPFINIRVVSDTAVSSIVDYEKITGLRMRGKRAAMAAYFLQKPGAAFKLIRFRRDMRRVKNIIGRIAEALVINMPENTADPSHGGLHEI
jgi:adenosylhomocysteine nucleosidase